MVVIPESMTAAMMARKTEKPVLVVSVKHRAMLHALSISDALDLHSGEIIANVERLHRSREFIELPKHLDAQWPGVATIRIILASHSSHVPKENRAGWPPGWGRFQYVHTPVHALWLSRVEFAFPKMARTFLGTSGSAR